MGGHDTATTDRILPVRRRTRMGTHRRTPCRSVRDAAGGLAFRQVGQAGVDIGFAKQ
jgi:hypothetical protein